MDIIRILFLADTHLGFDFPFRPRIQRRRRGPEFFANFKRAARPISESITTRLKGMYPNSEVIIFDSRAPNVLETETKNKEQFEAWAKGVDAVIATIGD